MTKSDEIDTPNSNNSPGSGSLKSNARGLKRRMHFWIWGGILAMTMIFLISVGLIIHQASAVHDNLQRVVSNGQRLVSELASGDFEGSQITAEMIQENTSAARATTTGPLWKIASIIPIVGANFSAVSELSVSADDIAVHAVTPLVEKYDALDLRMLSPTDGRIDVSTLRDAGPPVSAAAATVRLSLERIASIDSSRLVQEIADPIRSAHEQLSNISSVLNATASATDLMPGMLGAEQSRTYLILVQNSAESRATGGIPGALAVLRADNGLLTLEDQGSASALGAFTPALDVDPEQTALYTARLGTQMQNVNLTPHFPTAAETAKRMWEQRHPNQVIDGVLALDPVVLAHLLQATGPVDLTDPEVLKLISDTLLPSSLTAENVIPTLLSDVYGEIEDPKAQDAYFAAVAGQVFGAFTNGQGDSVQLIQALISSAQEKRLYLWSNKQREQDIIATTPLNGSVIGPESGGASFGVYFNDGTGAKMDYYVKRSVKLIQACSEGEYGQYTVRVTASNNAPGDAASRLPAYVTGGGIFGVEPGRISTNYVAYGPSQAFVEKATVDDKSVPVGSGKHSQRPVGTVQLELGPGETSTIDIVFSGVVQDAEPKLHVTPGIQPTGDVVRPFEREPCG